MEWEFIWGKKSGISLSNQIELRSYNGMKGGLRSIFSSIYRFGLRWLCLNSVVSLIHWDEWAHFHYIWNLEYRSGPFDIISSRIQRWLKSLITHLNLFQIFEI